MDMSTQSPFNYGAEVLAKLPRHSVSVAGIVINASGQVLVIRRRDNGHWQPPGGVLELDETFEQGVVREVAEETGAHVAIERLSGVYKNMTSGIVAIAFRCLLLTEPAEQTQEAAEVSWINPADIPRVMTPTFAARVLDALEPMPQVRIHDGTHLLDQP
jgi:8-oxo-dGTP diphosphatase